MKNILYVVLLGMICSCTHKVKVAEADNNQPTDLVESISEEETIWTNPYEGMEHFSFFGTPMEGDSAQFVDALKKNPHYKVLSVSSCYRENDKNPAFPYNISISGQLHGADYNILVSAHPLVAAIYSRDYYEDCSNEESQPEKDRWDSILVSHERFYNNRTCCFQESGSMTFQNTGCCGESFPEYRYIDYANAMSNIMNARAATSEVSNCLFGPTILEADTLPTRCVWEGTYTDFLVYTDSLQVLEFSEYDYSNQHEQILRWSKAHLGKPAFYTARFVYNRKGALPLHQILERDDIDHYVTPDSVRTYVCSWTLPEEQGYVYMVRIWDPYYGPAIDGMFFSYLIYSKATLKNQFTKRIYNPNVGEDYIW